MAAILDFSEVLREGREVSACIPACMYACVHACVHVTETVREREGGLGVRWLRRSDDYPPFHLGSLKIMAK